MTKVLDSEMNQALAAATKEVFRAAVALPYDHERYTEARQRMFDLADELSEAGVDTHAAVH